MKYELPKLTQLENTNPLIFQVFLFLCKNIYVELDYNI